MYAKPQTPFSCSLGTSLGMALGEVHWSLATEPAGVPNRPVVARSEQKHTAAQRGDSQALPLTDLDLHLTGHGGTAPDALRSLAALLRRIVASGRERPSPIEQDYVTGYLRQLLLVPGSPFFLDPLQLKAELNGHYLNRR